MTQFRPAYLAHQRQRWMRPDAYRYVRPDWQRFVRPDHAEKFRHEFYERKYNPDQPRDDHGRWTDETGNEDLVSSILGMAKQFAAQGHSPGYLRCLDICSPILERYQPPGADFNKWDFHRCMDACMQGDR